MEWLKKEYFFVQIVTGIKGLDNLIESCQRKTTHNSNEIKPQRYFTVQNFEQSSTIDKDEEKIENSVVSFTHMAKD